MKSEQYLPGTLVRLIQPELFHECGVFVVLETRMLYAEDQFAQNHSVCKVLQSDTGRVFEWYSDILEKIE